MTTTLIRYQGELAAIASRLRVHFAPPFHTAPDTDPGRRFVAAMAFFANDVHTGELAGPYTDEAAGVYARTLLIPDDEFTAHAHERDEDIAAFFRVPIEQIELKRTDLS